MPTIYALFIAVILSACTQPSTPKESTHKKTMCTKIYMPVCAEVKVQCVKAPCLTVKQTFSNICMMKNNQYATYLYDGRCDS